MVRCRRLRVVHEQSQSARGLTHRWRSECRCGWALEAADEGQALANAALHRETTVCCGCLVANGSDAVDSVGRLTLLMIFPLAALGMRDQPEPCRCDCHSPPDRKEAHVAAGEGSEVEPRRREAWWRE